MFGTVAYWGQEYIYGIRIYGVRTAVPKAKSIRHDPAVAIIVKQDLRVLYFFEGQWSQSDAAWRGRDIEGDGK
jgi:hypothetical protein